MLRVFQTICALLPIVALAILLDASVGTYQVSAKPLPLLRSVKASDPTPGLRGLKSLRFVGSMSNAPEPRDGKRARTKLSQPPTKPAPEAKSGIGESVVAREQRSPNRASSKGQSSVPRDVQHPRGESSIASRHKETTPAPYTRNAPRTSSFKKKTETLKRQRRQLKISAEKFHHIAAHHHLHNNSTGQRRTSHSLREFLRHARAAQSTFSQLAASNGTTNATESGELEMVIADIVNTVTQVLSEVATLAGSIPILGPELEGIVTQIQGVLTNIVDTAQGFLDNVLGTLKPIIDSVLPGIL